MRVASSFTYKGVQGYRLGYHPYQSPRMFVHIFYVDGLLVDTGQSHMRKAVIQMVSQWDVEQIFLTHHHEDHTGNVSALKKELSCSVLASSRCIQFMESPPPISVAQKLVWGSRPACTGIQKSPHQLETPNHTFSLVGIPGHAEDMVGLHEEKEGWFFSADLFVHTYIGYFLKNESMGQQIQSIRKVLDLDFEVLFCSHNPQLKGGKEKLRQKLSFLEDFYGKVAALHGKGIPPNVIFKELNFKEKWPFFLLSQGQLSRQNMVDSVVRDELKKPSS